MWRIEPRLFDPALVRLCEEAVREETGDPPQPHLEKSIRAYLRLVEKTIAHLAAS